MTIEEQMKQTLGRELDDDDKEVLEITLEFEEATNKILKWL